ncbi:MAG TPA: hypothetical protein VGK73_13430 [Polyangiaceae bacterium]
MNRSRTPVAGLLLLALLSQSAPAFADDQMQQCGQAFETAQQERLKGNYRAAREGARACSDVGCPAAIINECVKLFEAVQSEIPTVIFSARDRDGKELVDVQVAVDGVRAADRLEGRPLELDPGPHVFRFESPPLPTVEITQTIRVGDQRRIIEAVMGEERPAAQPGAVGAGSEAPQKKEQKTPAATYVLAGLGVVALGGFAFLRLSGASEYSDLEKECSPRCDPNDADSARLKYQMSYAALGLGIAALGGAAIIYFANSGSSESASVGLKVATTPQSASAHLLTRF